MPKNINDIIQSLPPERQDKINRRFQELMAEYMTLQDVRKARQLTQEDLAKTLGIGQDSVSRLEQRSDLHLSTLKKYINAMGGNLKIVAEFPDRPPVILEGLGEYEE